MNVGIGYLHVFILNAVVRDPWYAMDRSCVSVLAARVDFQNISNYEASVSDRL
jgi:hypothetical protein